MRVPRRPPQPYVHHAHASRHPARLARAGRLPTRHALRTRLPARLARPSRVATHQSRLAARHLPAGPPHHGNDRAIARPAHHHASAGHPTRHPGHPRAHRHPRPAETPESRRLRSVRCPLRRAASPTSLFEHPRRSHRWATRFGRRSDRSGRARRCPHHRRATRAAGAPPRHETDRGRRDSASPPLQVPAEWTECRPPRRHPEAQQTQRSGRRGRHEPGRGGTTTAVRPRRAGCHAAGGQPTRRPRHGGAGCRCRRPAPHGPGARSGRPTPERWRVRGRASWVLQPGGHRRGGRAGRRPRRGPDVRRRQPAARHPVQLRQPCPAEKAP